MINPTLKQKLVNKIIEAVNPQQIILFGRYAYGNPTIDSDLDLLVIMGQFKSKMLQKKKYERLYLI